jgi:hypothetical protein
VFAVGINTYISFRRASASKFWSNALRPSTTSVFVLLLICLSSPLPNALPYLQSIFTKRTTGHCLGAVLTKNLSVPHLNVVALTTLLPLCVLSISFRSKGLKEQMSDQLVSRDILASFSRKLGSDFPALVPSICTHTTQQPLWLHFWYIQMYYWYEEKGRVT